MIDRTKVRFHRLTLSLIVRKQTQSEAHPAVVPVYNARASGWEIHVGLGDGLDELGAAGNFADWWSYSVDDDTWTRLPDLPGISRHHPFMFGLGNSAYAGLGHSVNGIERDWYRYDPEQSTWTREDDFVSYDAASGDIATTQARVAGTEFTIERPLRDADNGEFSSAMQLSGGVGIGSKLSGSLGFVPSGDGDDHSTMATGELLQRRRRTAAAAADRERGGRVVARAAAPPRC